MLNPFKLLEKIIRWYSERISRKAKIIIAIFVLFVFIGMGLAGYKINDYFENNPDACILCHVHDRAQELWTKSKHNVVNCHECHHSTKKDQVVQMYRFVFLGYKTVSPRHGAIIVPSKLCMQCHWEKDKRYLQAPSISRSRYHARHVFVAKIECAKCHGYVAHQFLPEERFCFQCHKNMEVHGTGMENLACINCHTDRTENLRPDRKKCLFCHGSDSVRKELIAQGSIDVKHFQPSPEVIRKAIKIKIPAEAAMQFYCYECHRPHKKARPNWNDCLRCHSDTPTSGKHELHIKGMGMKCKDCHKPHAWRVTQAQAKKDCIKCHEYKEPKKFIS